MSVEDDVEDLKHRLGTVETCIQDSDTFDELKACIKPLSREDFHKAISATAKKKEFITIPLEISPEDYELEKKKEEKERKEEELRKAISEAKTGI